MICEIGGTGESTFAVNRARSLVAFNWTGGIYIVSFAEDTPRDCETWEKRVRRLVECSACYEVAWRSERVLQYLENDAVRTVVID